MESNRLKGHGGWAWTVGFSLDGSRIVSGSADQTVRLWDAKTGQPIGQPLRGHDDAVWSVAFSPDGSRIISGSWDATVRLWDAKTGQPIGPPLTGHQSKIRLVAFSPDGSRIVSGSDDNTLRLWDATTNWLAFACNRLQYHPLLNQPATVTTDPEFLTVAKQARQTCNQRVWQH